MLTGVTWGLHDTWQSRAGRTRAATSAGVHCTPIRPNEENVYFAIGYPYMEKRLGATISAAQRHGQEREKLIYLILPK